jgi:hypothetical protein
VHRGIIDPNVADDFFSSLLGDPAALSEGAGRIVYDIEGKEGFVKELATSTKMRTPADSESLPDMWQCPKCKAEFVQRNLQHSCGIYSVEDFLKGKTQRSIQLFWFYIHEWRKIGDIKLHPVKTSVSLLVKVRFSRVNRITKDGIVGHLWLKEKVVSGKFFKVEKLLPTDYLHHFEIKDESFIDNEFRKYMKMAYEIGERKHIRRSRGD